MSTEYIFLSVVAVLLIGCGLLLRSEARNYRGRLDSQKAASLSPLRRTYIKIDLDDVLGQMPEKDRNAILANVWKTIAARNRQSEGNEHPLTQAGNQSGATIQGNLGDEFASHEILDRINSVTMLLQILLLDRQDLPDPIRKQLNVASNTLLDAYQSMGKIRFDADTNQGKSE